MLFRSPKDQTYARYSYSHEQKLNDLPLGPLLDGSGYGGQSDPSLFMNFMLSETHIFSPRITNEFASATTGAARNSSRLMLTNPMSRPLLGSEVFLLLELDSMGCRTVV